MTINFPQRPKWLTFERLALWLIIIVLAIFAYKSCRKGDTWQQKLADKEAQRKKDVDSVQHQFNEYENWALEQIGKWADSSRALLYTVAILRDEKELAWSRLKINKKEADTLISKIEDKEGKDSVACLQLSRNYKEAVIDVLIFKNKSDQLTKQLDTAGQYKDKIITALGKVTNAAMVANDYTKKQYDSLYNSFGKLKPRNSWWVGADLTVAQGFVMAGPQLSFETKKGARYTLAGGLDSKNVGYYVRGELAWKISFRK